MIPYIEATTIRPKCRVILIAETNNMNNDINDKRSIERLSFDSNHRQGVSVTALLERHKATFQEIEVSGVT